ncbi:hypothetical protein Sjap_009096 [Stephania japonica]|uniref:Uncharacterized protein n=1 Tax=Stephania japonica TaxID=461633 RepID=A0AAP0PBZ4_9MAGN
MVAPDLTVLSSVVTRIHPTNCHLISLSARPHSSRPHVLSLTLGCVATLAAGPPPTTTADLSTTTGDASAPPRLNRHHPHPHGTRDLSHPPETPRLILKAMTSLKSVTCRNGRGKGLIEAKKTARFGSWIRRTRGIVIHLEDSSINEKRAAHSMKQPMVMEDKAMKFLG